MGWVDGSTAMEYTCVSDSQIYTTGADVDSEKMMAFKIEKRVRDKLNIVAAQLRVDLDVQAGEKWRQSETVDLLLEFADLYQNDWAMMVSATASRLEELRNRT